MVFVEHISRAHGLDQVLRDKEIADEAQPRRKSPLEALHNARREQVVVVRPKASKHRQPVFCVAHAVRELVNVQRDYAGSFQVPKDCARLKFRRVFKRELDVLQLLGRKQWASVHLEVEHCVRLARLQRDRPREFLELSRRVVDVGVRPSEFDPLLTRSTPRHRQRHNAVILHAQILHCREFNHIHLVGINWWRFVSRTHSGSINWFCFVFRTHPETHSIQPTPLGQRRNKTSNPTRSHLRHGLLFPQFTRTRSLKCE
mmetsp:Transcript_39184/g.77254  ORF Transcript_39184/g.77254 Transcript_39184/m.77254 type:complete len:258 (-) Transcript_39184:71-844(-)